MSNFDNVVFETVARKLNVLVAARDGSHRATIAEYLKRRGIGVVVTDCAATALKVAQSGEADLIVTGPAMPGFNGYDLTRTLRECLPEFPVILLSAGGERLDELLLDCALAVGTHAMPNADNVRQPGQNPAKANLRRAPLTPRERQVMDLVTQGHANKTVGRMLAISPRTVENHRAQIMRKLNARNLAELMRVAMMQMSAG